MRRGLRVGEGWLGRLAWHVGVGMPGSERVCSHAACYWRLTRLAGFYRAGLLRAPALAWRCGWLASSPVISFGAGQPMARGLRPWLRVYRVRSRSEPRP